MGKRSARGAKRGGTAAAPGAGRLQSRLEKREVGLRRPRIVVNQAGHSARLLSPVVRARKAPGRLPAFAALLGLLVAVGALLGWQMHRRASGQPNAGSAADAREAELLQAEQTHPGQSGPRRELAAYYLGHQRPFEALWELSMAREMGAVDAALTLDVAAALKQAGLPSVAVRILSAGRADFRGQAALEQALAETELELGEPAAAARVIQADPALRAGPDGLLMLSRAHLTLEDLPAARADWTRSCRAAEKGPGTRRPEWSLAAGRLAMALGEYPTARQLLTAAAKENPGDEATQYYAGMALLESGSPAGRAKAIAAFEQATRDDPHQARAGVELGRLLYERAGQWQRAAEIYRQALSMDGRSLAAEEGLVRVRTALKQPGEVLYQRARIGVIEDRPDEALRLYRRWGTLRPERWDSVLRAAECWMDMGRFPDAAREVERGLKRYPDNPELLSHLAQIYLRTDSRPEAARLCDRWLRADPTSGRPEWVRGQLAEKAMRIDDAIRWYEAAVRKDPRFGTYHAALGAALASRPAPERLRRARTELEQATALDPHMALFPYQLGQVLQQLGDEDGARRAYLRALDRDGDRLDAYGGLLAIARRRGRPGVTEFFAGLEREARDRLRDETAARQALALRPDDGQAHLELARSLLRRGDLAGARNHLEIAAAQPDGGAARPLLRRVERLQSVL